MNTSHLGTEDQDRIWEYYQNEAPESFDGSRARVSYLLSRTRQSDVILNIGCGSGLLEKGALERGVTVYSVDPIERSIERLKTELHLGDRAKVGYVQSLPFPDLKFDAVIISEVFEHLPPEIIKAGLIEIHRVLKPGGFILGTVPHKENLREQMVICPCCGKRFHRWGHEQSFDPEKVHLMLSPVFERVKSSPKLFITWEAVNWKGKLAACAKLCFFAVGIHGSNENIVFEGYKGSRA